MPTPRPIINATYGANDGTVMKWLSSVTNTSPMPTPMIAATIGRLIASSDPNAMNRITIAARRPTASVEPMGGSRARATTGPLSSTRKPGTLTSFAASINGCAVSAGMSPACWSKVTVA